MAIYKTALLSALLVSALSCSSQSQVQSNPQALPSCWYNLPENKGAAGAVSETCKTNPKADAAVHRAFAANTHVLDKLSSPTEIPSLTQARSHPADWVPWHLDGMIADFSIAEGGVFGQLLAGGNTSAKVTWQQKGQQKGQQQAAFTRSNPSYDPTVRSKATKITVTPQTTPASLSRSFEPVIRAALATGAVTDEKALRQSLVDQGQRFLAVSQALSLVPSTPDWHVSGFQLQLSLAASGQLTPVFGVGSTVLLYMDWQKSGDPAAVSANQTALSQNLSRLVQFVASELPQAIGETPGLKDSGLELNQIQLGLAMNLSGDVGIAEMSASVFGKLFFQKNADVTVALDPQVSPPQLTAGAIQMIDTAPKPEHLAYAQAVGIPVQAAAASDGVVYTIDQSKFHSGLKHALEMGTYFFSIAKKADTSRWQITQLELEFDASIGGDFKLATVSSSADILLDFNRVGS